MEMCENFGIEIDASSAGALQVRMLGVCDSNNGPRWWVSGLKSCIMSFAITRNALTLHLSVVLSSLCAFGHWSTWQSLVDSEAVTSHYVRSYLWWKLSVVSLMAKVMSGFLIVFTKMLLLWFAILWLWLWVCYHVASDGLSSFCEHELWKIVCHPCWDLNRYLSVMCCSIVPFHVVFTDFEQLWPIEHPSETMLHVVLSVVIAAINTSVQWRWQQRWEGQSSDSHLSLLATHAGQSLLFMQFWGLMITNTQQQQWQVHGMRGHRTDTSPPSQSFELT